GRQRLHTLVGLERLAEPDHGVAQLRPGRAACRRVEDAEGDELLLHLDISEIVDEAWAHCGLRLRPGGSRGGQNNGGQEGKKAKRWHEELPVAALEWIGRNRFGSAAEIIANSHVPQATRRNMTSAPNSQRMCHASAPLAGTPCRDCCSQGIAVK